MNWDNNWTDHIVDSDITLQGVERVVVYICVFWELIVNIVNIGGSEKFHTDLLPHKLDLRSDKGDAFTPWEQGWGDYIQLQGLKDQTTVTAFPKEVYTRLVKHPLVFNGCLANRRLTSSVKEAAEQQ